jgi:protein-tyrosine phosphatase
MIPMSQIINTIYVGSIANVNALNTSNPQGIKYILNCTENYYRAPVGIKKCWLLSMPDEAECHYSRVLFGVLRIHQAVTEGKTILVHCKGGVSRSRAIVAAYFVLFQGMTWDAAINEVLLKRKFRHSPHPTTIKTVRQAIEVAVSNKARKENGANKNNPQQLITEANNHADGL